MAAKHFTVGGLFSKLNGVLRMESSNAKQICVIRDTSMLPTLAIGEKVQVNTQQPVGNGDLVAVATNEFVDIRELRVNKGEYYLIAHNRRFPTVSMRDYRALHPGASFVGVVG